MDTAAPDLLTDPDAAVALADRLLDNGYSPIPIVGGTKRPGFKQWDQYSRKRMTRPRFRRLVAAGLGGSVGICGGRVVAVDIDVLDEALNARLVQLAEAMFGATPLHRVGRAPKRLLLYRAEGTIRSRSVALADGHGVDILGSSRVFVAYGLHPDTGRPYSWVLDDPRDIRVDELPAVSAAKIDLFLAAVKAIAPPRREGGRKETGVEAGGGSEGEAHRDEHDLVVDGRHAHLLSIALRICSDSVRAGHHGNVDGLTRAVWQAFQRTTDLRRPRSADGKPWEPKHARTVVVSTLKGLGSGKLTPRIAKTKGGEWTLERKRAYVGEARRIGANTTVVTVLKVLLSDLNRDGTDRCYPSVARVAERSGVSESSVHRSINWLERHGLLANGGVHRTYKTVFRLFDLSRVAHVGTPAKTAAPTDPSIFRQPVALVRKSA
jgi:hypothetical protein